MKDKFTITRQRIAKDAQKEHVITRIKPNVFVFLKTKHTLAFLIYASAHILNQF